MYGIKLKEVGGVTDELTLKGSRRAGAVRGGHKQKSREGLKGFESSGSDLPSEINFPEKVVQ